MDIETLDFILVSKLFSLSPQGLNSIDLLADPLLHSCKDDLFWKALQAYHISRLFDIYPSNLKFIFVFLVTVIRKNE